jgi:hypothetical protein
MTEAEIRSASVLPRNLAYMACHFSPYGTGLVNIPERLPPGSLLIVNDRVPVMEHDPQKVTKQLSDAVNRLRAFGVLMDLQIPDNPRTAQIVKCVTSALTCPVGVSEAYADKLTCPIFGAPPIYRALADYKKSRPLWLDAFQETALLTVTSTGCTVSQGEVLSDESFFDETLQCKYQYTIQKNSALFCLSRQVEQMQGYLRHAEANGIEVAVGLYQQLRGISV